VLAISIDVRERQNYVIQTANERECVTRDFAIVLRIMPMARLAPFSMGTGGYFLRLN
jgi:hypothetical protein